MRSAITMLASAMLAGLLAGVLGCSESPTNSDAAAPAPRAAVAPAVEAPPAPAGGDLEAAMQAMAAALRAEAAVLRKAIASSRPLGETDHQAYWAALTDRRLCAGQIKALIDANPTWVQSVCGWYDSLLRAPSFEIVGLNRRLMNRNRQSDGSNDFTKLLRASAPSAEAARESLDATMNHPADPTNLYIMCLKFGHIKDE